MLKIAVVEDQQEVRDELCRFIRQYAAENSLQVEVLPIEDGAVIAEHYEPGYDIIFMDVEMPSWPSFAFQVWGSSTRVVLPSGPVNCQSCMSLAMLRIRFPPVYL
jgi:CheY-like chemotaxis protein